MDGGRGVGMATVGCGGGGVRSKKRVVTSRVGGKAAASGASSRVAVPRSPAPSRPLASLPRPMVDRGQREALESVRLEAAGAGFAMSVPEADLTCALVPDRDLVLANPILVASGTFGYGIEYDDIVDVQRLGAICCKGTTLKPRIGNPTPRVTETPGGMLNSIGLQNPGVDAVIEKYGPLWQEWQVPVIVNVAGHSVAEYVECAKRLDGVPGIAGIELNISCPNVGAGGLQFAIDASAAGSVTSAVRRATSLPLLVKLSPNVADVRPIARAIEDAGADALTAVNTLSGIAVDPMRRKPFLGNTFGGLSGPAIKPVALKVVYEVAQVVSIPIVAIGGVVELADVLDYMAVGAVAVQVGTAIFADPTIPERLIDELAAECRLRGLESYRELVGTALPAKSGASSAKGVEYRP
jgi:dihydroorotate dehydrogenase (NAD+) catalytic subunit